MKFNKRMAGWLWVTTLFFVALTAVASPPPAGVAPIAPPPGGFGIDGDLLANTPQANVGDWIANTNVAPGSGTGVLGLNGAPLDPIRTFHFVDAYNDQSDDIFGGGEKWTDNPNTWTWTTGKPSSKTDINNVLLHIASDTNDHVWTVVAADRLSTSGNSYIDFELLQNSLTRNSNGTFSSAGPNGGRTTNDLLLSIGFTSGGAVADFVAWRWMPAGSGFAYTDITSLLPTGRVFVALNSNLVSVPYGAFGQTNYGPNAFVEAAIDLTALIGGFDPCFSVGFKTIMVKTKASNSSSASIEDFIDPIQYSLNIGPAANAGPDQVRCSEGDTTAFPLSGQASSGLQSIGGIAWSVLNGSATIDDPTSLVTTARVSSASATLRLTVTQVNGCVKTDDVVLTVQQPPVCAITGPTSTCLRSTNTFTAPPGMNVYAWSVIGNGFISGPANQSSVKVVSGALCGTNYTLSLTAVTNVCSIACGLDVAVVDLAAPVLTCPPDVTLDCPADTRTNNTGVASAVDTCSHATVTYADSVTNLCGATRIIARTWTATDECGNSSSCVQTITVRDITAPIITCPTNRVLEFPANTTPANTGTATATDTCSTPAISFTDTVTTNCGNTFTIARLWTATDACGNSSSCQQTITVRDTTAPVISCPLNLTLECPAVTTTNATGVATATDAGGSVTITYADTTTTNCGNTFTIARRWTATDLCGNASACTQTITVRDSTAPVISCPPNLTLECPAVTTTNATGAATATDACGSVTITYQDAVTNACGGTKTISRRWTATDLCGNASSCTQTITVRDTTAPVISCPPNLTLECPAVTTTNVTGVATATDACGSATISYADTVTTNCGNTYSIARRWTAVDQCGNSSSCTQTITVQDTTAPVITCPPNVTLECPAVTTTNATGTATATDACGTPVITSSDSVVNGCGNTRTISRTWRATDACGNSSTCVQTITVRDTTPPTLTPPPNITVECGSSTAPATTGTATASDTCNTFNVSYSDSVSNTCGLARVISRRWLAVDACGNSNSAVQTITVRDTTPPVLTLPSNRVLNCPGDTRTNNTGVATATDVCGAVNVTYSDVVTNGCGLTRTVFRTWIATDQCGNSSSGVQTIIVQNVPPTISCRSINVQCPADVPPPYANLAAFLAAGGSAASSCDTALDFSLVSDSGLIGRCPGQVTRVYRVTDDCGASAQCTQTITVADTIAPTITCPPSLTIECGNSLAPATTGTATATDNCSTNVGITYSDSIVDSSYNLRWYAADPGLNTGPYAPTYLQLAPGSLPCPTGGRAVDPLRNAVAYAPNGQLDALTSLGSAPLSLGQIVPFELVIEASGGPGTDHGTIEFTSTWAAYTTSNNRFGYDTNYQVYCAFVDAADPGSIDPNYNARVESFTSTVINRGTINEQIQGTFRVTGIESGDRIVVEIWVVLDSTMPNQTGGTIAANLAGARKLSSPPQDISIGTQTVSIGNLSKIGDLPPPQTQPPPPSIPPQPPVLPGATLSVIDRTWAATDDCGNRSTCTQRLTVRDTTPPTLVPPPNFVLECPADTSTNSTGVATALDACGTATLRYSDVVSNACGNTRKVFRTWTATDGNNNTNSVLQTITVQDTTPPTLLVGTNKTLLAGAPLAFEMPIVSDTCGAAFLSVLGTVTNNLSSPIYDVTRTWRATDACGNAATNQQTLSVIAVQPSVMLLSVRPPLLTLRWPAYATDYRLEYSTDLKRWAPLDLVPSVTNGWCVVQVTMTGPQRYFRIVNTPPALDTLRRTAGKLTLTWPTAPSGFSLQSTDALTPPGWVDVVATPTVSNTLNYVDLDLSAPKRFYRLKKSLP